MEAAERQRVRNYARKPRCGWFRVLKAIVGRLAKVGPDLRAGRSNEEGRYLFSAGSSEICPYRGLRIARIYSKFLAQVTERQLFVNASLARRKQWQH